MFILGSRVGICYVLKPIQNKKGQKKLGYPRKKQSFYKEKDCFFSGTPNFFGYSYFEAALVEISIFSLDYVTVGLTKLMKNLL